MANVIFRGQYIEIIETHRGDSKTPVLEVLTNNEVGVPPVCSGNIMWHPYWRKFCFFPADKTIWDGKSLGEIVCFLNMYNTAKKQR